MAELTTSVRVVTTWTQHGGSRRRPPLPTATATATAIVVTFLGNAKQCRRPPWLDSLVDELARSGWLQYSRRRRLLVRLTSLLWRRTRGRCRRRCERRFGVAKSFECTSLPLR